MSTHSPICAYAQTTPIVHVFVGYTTIVHDLCSCTLPRHITVRTYTHTPHRFSNKVKSINNAVNRRAKLEFQARTDNDHHTTIGKTKNTGQGKKGGSSGKKKKSGKRKRDKMEKMMEYMKWQKMMKKQKKAKKTKKNKSKGGDNDEDADDTDSDTDDSDSDSDSDSDNDNDNDNGDDDDDTDAVILVAAKAKVGTGTPAKTKPKVKGGRATPVKPTAPKTPAKSTTKKKNSKAAATMELDIPHHVHGESLVITNAAVGYQKQAGCILVDDEPPGLEPGWKLVMTIVSAHTGGTFTIPADQILEVCGAKHRTGTAEDYRKLTKPSDRYHTPTLTQHPSAPPHHWPPKYPTHRNSRPFPRHNPGNKHAPTQSIRDRHWIMRYRKIVHDQFCVWWMIHGILHVHALSVPHIS